MQLLHTFTAAFLCIKDSTIFGKCKEFYVENILENLQTNNPSEMARSVLMEALARNARQPFDDMSVLVAGIWRK